MPPVPNGKHSGNPIPYIKTRMLRDNNLEFMFNSTHEIGNILKNSFYF